MAPHTFASVSISFFHTQRKEKIQCYFMTWSIQELRAGLRHHAISPHSGSATESNKKNDRKTKQIIQQNEAIRLPYHFGTEILCLSGVPLPTTTVAIAVVCVCVFCSAMIRGHSQGNTEAIHLNRLFFVFHLFGEWVQWDKDYYRIQKLYVYLGFLDLDSRPKFLHEWKRWRITVTRRWCVQLLHFKYKWFSNWLLQPGFVHRTRIPLCVCIMQGNDPAP